ncbi:amino acid adenylation domain-containing protein [Streptomyces sp. NPDC015350]|uniref:amino acid adenylation domain-containing protein n=1 Tax=Streptomyces sp. NPDC015350 TaxID=3364955 RepID=UPI00370238A8
MTAGADRVSDEQRARIAERIRAARVRSRDGTSDTVPRHPLAQGEPVASSAQERLWLLDRLLDDRSLYVMPVSLRIDGLFDAERFQRAVTKVVERHQVLRTVFVERDGLPVPTVSEVTEAPLRMTDLSKVPASEREEQAKNAVRAAAQEPFDLSKAPMIRIDVIRQSAQEHLLVLGIHHIAADGWSLPLLWAEIAQVYEALRLGEQPTFAETAPQYSDFAHWQRAQLVGDGMERQMSYWRAQLENLKPLHLPTDRRRPRRWSGHGDAVSFTVPAATTSELTEIGRSRGATPFVTLLAAFQALLARHAGHEDITVGTPVAGRPHAALESLIGLLANTLVLRTDVSGDPTFEELVERTRKTVVAAYSHQDVPFEKLVEDLRPERNLSQNPLFQVMFQLNVGQQDYQLPNATVTSVAPETHSSKFDLTFALSEQADGLSGQAIFATDLFNRETVEHLVEHYQRLLLSAASGPSRRLSELDMLGPQEEYAALSQRGERKQLPPVEQCLHHLILDQAEATPDAPAVRCGNRTLSYRELADRSARLAAWLRQRGLRTGDLVGVHLERSTDLVVSLLAVMRAGGAYVPIDPSFPRQRVNSLLSHCAIRRLISRGTLLGETPVPAHVDVVDLDRDAAVIAEAVSDIPATGTPEQLAYVIYTSGSTGHPKGVMVPHRGVVNFAQDMKERLSLGPHDVVGALTTVSFDISVLELLVPLTAGSTVHVLAREVAQDGQLLTEVVDSAGITVLQATPTGWSVLIETGWPGADVRVLCGGETLPEALAVSLRHRVSALWNVYGPTETSIWSTAEELTDHGGASMAGATAPVSIGRPLSRTSAYVLDSRTRPVPVGATGELYLAGSGVAHGYLGQAALTAGRFVPDPFGEPGTRMYRTGDLVRRLMDDRLEFVGRNDEQVKVGGHRIELGEIESCLRTHPDVAQAAVCTHGSGTGRRLVGYTVPRNGIDPGQQALRDHVSQSLPAYMVPTEWVSLDRLPLTPNGKIDRSALTQRPVPVAPSVDGKPGTEREERIAAVWAEVLGLKRIDVNDNFFTLGGDSRRAAQSVARLRAELDLEITVRSLFEAPTVAEFAAALENAEHAAVIPRRPGGDPAPASYTQRRMWFLEQLRSGGYAYNVAPVLRLHGCLDEGALRAALEDVVTRHDILRTRFLHADGALQQIVDDSANPWLATMDLTSSADAVTDSASWAAELAHQPFDLTEGPLLRARLLRLHSQEHVLALALHHSVVDGSSLPILLRDLSGFYRARLGHSGTEPPRLTRQFGDFAHWELSRDAAAEDDLAFWKERLHSTSPTELPTDLPRPAEFTGRGQTLEFAIPDDVAAQVREVSKRQGTTVYVTLMAAFMTVVSRLSGRPDIVLGSPMAGQGRLYPELENVIGPFVNTVVLQGRVTDGLRFVDLLNQVRQEVIEAEAHHNVPFERLVEELRPERELSRHPLFQIMFAHGSDELADLHLPGVRAEPFPVPEESAKFDLSMVVMEADQGMTGTVTYATDLYRRESMEHLVRLFLGSLTAAVADPGCDVARLPAPDAHDVARLTPTPATDERRAYDLVRAQARRTPDATAVTCGSRSLSYAQLDARVNRLAGWLLAHGAGPQSPVGLLADRSVDTVVALLAVLASGAPCVPLDSGAPVGRNALVLRESAAEILLTDGRHAALPGLPTFRSALLLDAAEEELGDHPDGPVRTTHRPDDAAYITYTSGSTGAPKGVVSTHRGVANYLEYLRTSHGLGPGDTVMQLAALSFDASVRDIVGPLVCGAHVVVSEESAARDPRSIRKEMSRRGVNVLLSVVPSLLTALSAVSPDDKAREAGDLDVRLVLTSGEALTSDQVRRARTLGSDVVVVNQYGPTECTMTSTWYRIAAEEPVAGPLPIGRPIPGAACLVLDPQLQPLPTGAVGEVYLTGAGLARGYHGSPVLTAERFVANPHGPAGDLMFRTGDLARWNAQGQLVFHGRTDRQVKIRGVRVEPGEVEAALCAGPGVRGAAVVARGAPGDETELVAYVEAGGGPVDVGALRSRLGATLPPQLQPSRYVVLDALPRTPHGKVDHAALPEPRREPGGEHVPPRDRLELQLTGIWEELLDRSPIGVREDFFHIGGHSLKAVEMIQRVHAQTGVDVPLSTVFIARTVEQLAEELARSGAQAERLLFEMNRSTSPSPPLFLVHPQSGGVSSYVTLVQELGDARPVYGVEAVGYNSDTSPLTGIPEMARRYVDAITEIRPHGPYLLAGWSFGGNVAHEMAALLEAAGERVAFLGVIDARAFGEDGIDGWYAEAGELDRVGILHGIDTEALRGEGDMEEAKERLSHLLLSEHRVARHADARAIRRMVDVFTTNGRIADDYRTTRQIETDIYLFRTADLHPTLPNPQVRPRSWARRTKGAVRTVTVPGNHHDVMEAPHVQVLAQRLLEVLT